MSNKSLHVRRRTYSWMIKWKRTRKESVGAAHSGELRGIRTRESRVGDSQPAKLCVRTRGRARFKVCDCAFTHACFSFSFSIVFTPVLHTPLLKSTVGASCYLPLCSLQNSEIPRNQVVLKGRHSCNKRLLFPLASHEFHWASFITPEVKQYVY